VKTNFISDTCIKIHTRYQLTYHQNILRKNTIKVDENKNYVYLPNILQNKIVILKGDILLHTKASLNYQMPT
jgi:hypothetical protein